MLSFIIIISSSILYLTTIIRMAAKYFFMANEGMTEDTKLAVELFNAAHEQNDYEVSKHASSLRFLVILVILSRRSPALCATSSPTRAHRTSSGVIFPKVAVAFFFIEWECRRYK
jgi:hypothetical protein